MAEVIGIDPRSRATTSAGGEFLRLDIRHSVIGELVRAVGIDTVVHTATTVDSFNRDPRAAHETNVIGSMNLLAGCSPNRRSPFRTARRRRQAACSATAAAGHRPDRHSAAPGRHHAQ
ncbi:MAG: NAD-dependent epimerase/dehydratase family protein [Candidatus Dormibacteraeota bacterium]|uniref:NAD-dependent epimerase/dehydratase family protein n=1 Tax=Candidatus Dormiibacter inghamiae TaxID=3127013 RepID=A0A934KBT8_9BACT|nr:NAD-dependent epimerase/dehydratase family protein [Candidatus Dormibacteraeota bacterium]MBJ7605998.1 NAD-dependent epimerase/dehydratase family protein [Candidatus Dormibacteraeota bacterium]